MALLFDPNAAKAGKQKKDEKKQIIANLRTWSYNFITSEDLKADLNIDVREVICGDPNCAPIDTVFTFIWMSEGEGKKGKGMFAIPLAPDEIAEEELRDFFPDEEVLTQWKRGKKARWPPLPPLRFKLGDRVECRIGPHPVKGWAPGRVTKLYYSEPNWPPNMIAPYQVALHDGRLIFAPQDVDHVIRLRPAAAPDAPSSPDYAEAP